MHGTVSRESTFYLYFVKVESGFSRNDRNFSEIDLRRNGYIRSEAPEVNTTFILMCLNDLAEKVGEGWRRLEKVEEGGKKAEEGRGRQRKAEEGWRTLEKV